MTPAIATLVALLAPSALLADSAPNEQQGDWILRGGFHVLNPEGENLKPVFPEDPALTSTLVLDDATSVTIDVTYMFSNSLGVELWAPYPFSHDIDLKPYSGGTVGAGDTDLFNPSLSLVWRPARYEAGIQPYVGLGAHWTTYSPDTSGDFSDLDLELDDSIGFAGVAGVDVFLDRDKKWFLNLNVRYFDMSSDVTVRTPDDPIAGPGETLNLGDVSINPWAYGLTVGYRAGTRRVAAAVPVAAAPVAAKPAKCADTDGDGVCDADDRCPNTAAGDRVGPYGCSCDVTVQLQFKFDSAELTAEDIAALDKVALRLRELQFVEGEVAGHTDSVGDDAYNLDLSTRRAQSVIDHLASKGIAAGRMTPVGYGETRPIADDSTPEGRATNRRVVIHRTDCAAAN